MNYLIISIHEDNLHLLFDPEQIELKPAKVGRTYYNRNMVYLRNVTIEKLQQIDPGIEIIGEFDSNGLQVGQSYDDSGNITGPANFDADRHIKFQLDNEDGSRPAEVEILLKWRMAPDWKI